MEKDALMYPPDHWSEWLCFAVLIHSFPGHLTKTETRFHERGSDKVPSWSDSSSNHTKEPK